MRKPIILMSLFGGTIFVVGVMAGQIAGVSVSSAASKPAIQTNIAAAPRFNPGHAPVSLGPRADGTVKAVSGNTITVQADGNHGPNPSKEYENVTTILLTSTTKYQAGPGQTGSAKSIKAGSFIVAEGTVKL